MLALRLVAKTTIECWIHQQASIPSEAPFCNEVETMELAISKKLCGALKPGGSQPQWGRKTQTKERHFTSSSQIPNAAAGTLTTAEVSEAPRCP